jgi:hypothetical protein
VRIRVFVGVGLAAALLGLAACRSSPTVAAYIDDTTITEDQVTKLIDDFGKSQIDQVIARELLLGTTAGKLDRAVVVDYLVADRLCERAKQKLNFPVEQPQIPDQGGELGKVSELGEILVRTESCERAVPAGAPVKPTQADAQQVFDNGVAGGIWPADAASEVIPGLLTSEDLSSALSRRKVLDDAVAGTRVTINPRYGTVDVPLIRFRGGSPAVALSFGEQGPVENRPVAPTSAPAQPQ